MSPWARLCNATADRGNDAEPSDDAWWHNHLAASFFRALTWVPDARYVRKARRHGGWRRAPWRRAWRRRGARSEFRNAIRSVGGRWGWETPTGAAQPISSGRRIHR